MYEQTQQWAGRRRDHFLLYLVEERTVVHGVLLALDLQVVRLRLSEEDASTNSFGNIRSAYTLITAVLNSYVPLSSKLKRSRTLCASGVRVSA